MGQLGLCASTFNGAKVAGNEAGATTLSGYYDPTSWAGHRIYWGVERSQRVAKMMSTATATGATATMVVVTNGGSYYRCILAHTSGASSEPGVGASWATYWDLLTLPSVGSICSAYADVNLQ
ncbi:MAG: hypothetical protein IPK16_30735 [Anaerolineales bacterium]|nr:hypothetical protein [Anaerolineales bacterium]